jgi:4a-hydroxytetrahydrobiopterin dehydratase
MTLQLEAKKRRSCQRVAAPLSLNQIEYLYKVLQTKWDLINGKMLRQVFEFPNFMETMVFVNDIAAIAEEMEHHPDISISCEMVTIEITTHAIGALSENDFFLARRIEHVR